MPNEIISVLYTFKLLAKALIINKSNLKFSGNMVVNNEGYKNSNPGGF